MKTIKIDDKVAEYHIKQLGRLRTWMEGFRAAGGKPPHDEDALRIIQLLLESRK